MVGENHKTFRLILLRLFYKLDSHSKLLTCMNLIDKQALFEMALKLSHSQNFYGDDYLLPLQKLLNSLNTETE